MTEFFEDLRTGNATVENMDDEVKTQISLTLHHRLQQLTIFNKPPPKFISELANMCVPIVFGKGDIIYSEGENGDQMYILYSGIIDVVVGGKTVNQIQKQGQFFGEKCITNQNTPRDATLSKKNFISSFVSFKKKIKF